MEDQILTGGLPAIWHWASGQIDQSDLARLPRRLFAWFEWSPDGRHLIWNHDNVNPTLWTVGSNPRTLNGLLFDPGDKDKLGRIGPIQWSPAADRIAIGADNSKAIWDFTSLKKIANYPKQFTPALWTSNDELWGWRTDPGKQIMVISATTGKELEKINAHRDTVYQMESIQPKNQAISGAYDGLLKLWDLRSREEILSVQVGHRIAAHLRSAHDGRFIASHEPGVLKVRTTGDLQVIAEFEEAGLSTPFSPWSPDGWLYLGTGQRRILFNPDTDETIEILAD